MSLYFAKLPLPYEGMVEECHTAIESGRQLVLDDLHLNPARAAKDYLLAAVSYVYASLLPNKAKLLLAQMAGHPLLAEASQNALADFAMHKIYLEGLRKSSGGDDWCGWASCAQDLGFGIALAADELAQSDEGWQERGGSTAREFVLPFISAMPDHSSFRPTKPIVRPAVLPSPSVPIAETEDPAAAEVIVTTIDPVAELTAEPVRSSATPLTTTELAAQWLAAKRISKSEFSRKNRSAALFCEAMGLSDAPATELANIGDAAVERFINHADALPPPGRARKTRISNVKGFIAYAQSVGIDIPELDWSNVK